MTLKLKLCLILALVLFFTHTVNGTEYVFDENSHADVYPSDEMDDLSEALPYGVRDELDGFFSADDTDDRGDLLGEKLSFKSIAGVVWQSISDVFPSWLKILGTMLSVVVLSSVIKNTLSAKMSENICSGTVALISALSAGSIALKGADLAVTFISQISNVMNAMIPVMTAVMLSGGGVTQSSVNSGALMLYINISENIMDRFLVPLAGMLFALSTFSGVFKEVNVSSLISGIQRFLMSVFGFSLMIFSFVLGIQTSLASSTDSLSMRTVKFAIGSYVPFVGGAVSEALSTVTAGLSHVRRMTGVAGILIILLTVLPTLINLFMYRISLLMCKSIAETLECPEAASPLGDADKILSLFLAFSAMSSVFFIFATVLFMNSGLS